MIDTSDSSTTNFLHVLGTNGEVMGTPVPVESPPNQVGVKIPLSDGRKAIVRFRTDGPGGTIQILDAGGILVVNEALPTGIQDLPLFVN